MREIHLANAKGVALVDDEDFEEASRYRWHLATGGYAKTSLPQTAGEARRETYLHWLVSSRMGLEGKVKPRNGIGLDCRRCNLRPRLPSVTFIDDSTVRVELTDGKGAALVDAMDADVASMYSWRLNPDGYAIAHIPKGQGKWTAITLHKAVANRIGLLGMVDHENRDRLDCRRDNLRSCTQAQNSANSKTQRNNKLGVKGVYALGDRFRAQIKAGGKKIHLGIFGTVEEASDAYYAAAQQHFGEFACRG